MARYRSFGVGFLVVLLAVVSFFLGGVGRATPSAQQATPLATPQPPPAVTPGGTLPGNPKIQLVQVASGLVDPINITNAGDGSGRLFVIERVGRIRIVDGNGNLLDDPFLDIRDNVKTDFLEQGLLGAAFAPDYSSSGLFYVLYADYTTNGNEFLVQYHVSANDPNKADPDSAKLIYSLPKYPNPGDPYVNHNGGTVRFGPDGMLYWTTGDGGLAGDPYDNAQNIRNEFGKIHRIDVSGASGTESYKIPDDNPFARSSAVNPAGFAIEDPANYHPGADPTIWAYGLRNPWQFNFDSKTGDLYIADVGQNAWEEINFQEAGAKGGQNYGWDWLEGSHCYPEYVSDCPRSQIGVLPVAEYNHSKGDCSISGAGVSRTGESPTLDGVYFASDFCSGRVWGLKQDDSGTWQFQELLDTELLVTGGGIGEDGAVFFTSCNCVFDRSYDPFANPQGGVWRVVQSDKVPAGAATPPPEGAATPAAATEEEATPAASTPETGAATPAASAGGSAQTVTMVDIAFQPKDLTIPANTDVTVDLPNNGASLHNFSIDELNISVDVQPGQTGSVTINAPAGTYQFYCNVPGHKEAGMVGTLTVQ
ncbi:MAG: PQQ-dependent sugar dehydrogenase [Thermomicrobiales bacterium]